MPYSNAAQFFTNDSEVYLAYTSLLTIMPRLATEGPCDILAGLKSTLMYMHGFRLTMRVQSSWYIDDDTIRIFQRNTVVKHKLAAVFTIGDTTAAVVRNECDRYEVFILKTAIGFKPCPELNRRGLEVRTQSVLHRLRTGSIRTLSEDVLSRYGFKFIGDDEEIQCPDIVKVFSNDTKDLSFVNTPDGVKWLLADR